MIKRLLKFWALINAPEPSEGDEKFKEEWKKS